MRGALARSLSAAASSPPSRIWHDRLTGAAAGTAITLTTLWVVLASATAAAVTLRA